jgi:hypothetical protein
MNNPQKIYGPTAEKGVLLGALVGSRLGVDNEPWPTFVEEERTRDTSIELKRCRFIRPSL